MKPFWPWLRLLGGLAIVVALAWRLGADAFVAGLAAVDALSVTLALLIGAATTVCSAWRWCIVARGLGMRLALPGAVADCYQALFLNSVLPAGILGDVQRALSHGRRAGDVGNGVRAVVLERFAGLAVLFAVGAATLFGRPALLPTVAGDWLPSAGLAGLGVAAVAWWAARARSAARVRAVLGATWGEVRATTRAVGNWPAVVLLSAAALVGYLLLFVVAARAAGAQAPIGELLPLLVLSLLAMAVPINLGGWGPREAVTAVGFGAVGFGAAQGFTAAVVYGVLSLISCLPGVVVMVVRRIAAITAARRTTPRDLPAALVLSRPTPATAARSHLRSCTPAYRGSAGVDDRPLDDRLSRIPA